jgi:hypothetical protein
MYQFIYYFVWNAYTMLSKLYKCLIDWRVALQFSTRGWGVFLLTSPQKSGILEYFRREGFGQLAEYYLLINTVLVV